MYKTIYNIRMKRKRIMKIHLSERNAYLFWKATDHKSDGMNDGGFGYLK